MRDRYVRGGGEERRGEKRVFTVRNYFRIRGRSLIFSSVPRSRAFFSIFRTIDAREGMESLLSSFSSTNFYHYRKGEYPRSELSNSMHSKFLNNNKIPIRFLNLSRIRTIENLFRDFDRLSFKDDIYNSEVNDMLTSLYETRYR